MNNRWFVDVVTESAAHYPHTTFSKKGTVYTCVNPFSYHLVRKYRALYGEMDGVYIDGLLMTTAINMLWRRHIPRLSFDMVGMAADLFKRLDSTKNNESVYFIGAREEELQKTINVIKDAYPDMNIAGYRNGYFRDSDDRLQAIRRVVMSDADFAVVGMGSPIQELFALDLKKAGFKGIVFTCGGFLHQTANGINYYPEWVNNYNLRAFYRLRHEKGVWKRLYNVLIEFPILFIYDSLSSLLHSRQ